jgi:hypothetical protein
MNREMNLNKVDSEIALTALLSAAVAGYPAPTLSVYPVVKLTALGLLVLTLARRTGIVNGLTGDASMIRATTYVMDPATFISFLYLSYLLARWMSKTTDLGSDPSVVMFAIVTSILVFVVFLGSELLFRASLREGERVFSATSRQHRGEAFGAVLSQIAAFVGESRRLEGETRQVKLTRFYDQTVEDYSWDEQVQLVKSFLVMLISFAIPPLGYGLLAVVGTRIFDVGWAPAVVLLLPVILVSAFFRLWYSNYGLVQVEDRNGYITFLGEVVTFLVVGHMAV